MKEKKIVYKCEICEKCFPSLKSLSSHIGWHKSGKRKRSAHKLPKEKRKCAYEKCNVVFSCRTTDKTRYCSKECANKAKLGEPSKKQLPRETRVCKLKECKNTFVCSINNTKKYCSIKCARKSKKGIKSWNNGLTKETDERIKKYSEKKKGKPSWTKGLTKKTDERIAYRASRQIGKIKHPEEGRRSAGKKNSKNTKRLWKDPVYIKKQMKARGVKPNKLEKKLENILEEVFPNEWKYVGDGEFIIGGKCPDFININRQKKLIELYGDYWHSEKIQGRPKEQHMEERKMIFSQQGYKTLIIWEKEMRKINLVIERIKNFLVE